MDTAPSAMPRTHSFWRVFVARSVYLVSENHPQFVQDSSPIAATVLNILTSAPCALVPQHAQRQHQQAHDRPHCRRPEWPLNQSNRSRCRSPRATDAHSRPGARRPQFRHWTLRTAPRRPRPPPRQWWSSNQVRPQVRQSPREKPGNERLAPRPLRSKIQCVHQTRHGPATTAWRWDRCFPH